MQSQGNNKTPPQISTGWIPLSHSATFLLSKGRLLLLSILLFFLTAFLTWLGFKLSTNFIDGYTVDFMQTPPDNSTIWGWIKHKGWLVVTWLYYFISRIVSFYLAFLIAYTLTSPGYVLLSTAAEKLYAGEEYEMDEGFTVGGVFRDIFEGFKIACFGILVTIAALIANFIPIAGQLVVFLLYTYYSALMFVDYPASRRRWTLGTKISWLRENYTQSFQLGILPALVSFIPVLNIFLIALLFPLLTVHATLNFTNLVQAKNAINGDSPHGYGN